MILRISCVRLPARPARPSSRSECRQCAYVGLFCVARRKSTWPPHGPGMCRGMLSVCCGCAVIFCVGYSSVLPSVARKLRELSVEAACARVAYIFFNTLLDVKCKGHCCVIGDTCYCAAAILCLCCTRAARVLHACCAHSIGLRHARGETSRCRATLPLESELPEPLGLRRRRWCVVART